MFQFTGMNMDIKSSYDSWAAQGATSAPRCEITVAVQPDAVVEHAAIVSSQPTGCISWWVVGFCHDCCCCNFPHCLLSCDIELLQTRICP